MQTALGDRAVAIARELTKVHEQIWRGQLSAAEGYFSGTEPRGEFTLVVEGKAGRPAQWSEDKVQIALKFGIKLDVSPAALAKRLSEESGWDRKELYSLITAMKKTDDSG
jgi:16S rRNA (cytidine1402-2'-O)-methyltransferase